MLLNTIHKCGCETVCPVHAAALALLEALEALTDPEGHIWHGVVDPANSECTGECQAARAAIAQAKGEK